MRLDCFMSVLVFLTLWVCYAQTNARGSGEIEQLLLNVAWKFNATYDITLNYIHIPAELEDIVVDNSDTNH